LVAIDNDNAHIESYGGHYGPAFVTYFDQQNDAIAKGTLTGVPIVVSALMVNK
jgi:carboxypeptidase C (cathepsin A)